VAATAKLFQRTLVETKPGVDKRNYLEQFVSRALAAKANGVYIIEVEIAANQPWPSRDDFVEQLLATSKHASTVPLVPASADPPAKFEDLSPEVRRAYAIYPLVEGETVISINMLCLEKDWEGLRRSVVFIDRETNLSRAYFAAPTLRAEPRTPGVTPALLLLRVSSAPVLLASTDGGPDAAIDAAQREFDLKVFSIVLDTISTLSWATPAGPFVAAGAAILHVIVEALFGVKSNLLDEIRKIADDVVDRIAYFEKTQTIKDQLNYLVTFSKYIKSMQGALLNTNDRGKLRKALTEENGILSQINQSLGPNVAINLLTLQSALEEDDDLKPGIGDPKAPYTSRHDWSIASAKLNLLFLTVTFHVIALKLKIVLTAKLYESGFDYNGDELDPHHPASNPDDTFSLLVQEVKGLQATLPPIIADVRRRRMGMITKGESYHCQVAYSNEWKPKAKREDWKALFNEHDALYTGDYHDQMVRSMEDNPSVKDFGVPAHYKSFFMGGGVYLEPDYISHSDWHRLEIRDLALYNGRDPQQWVLSNCGVGSNRYAKNETRFTDLKNKYNDKIRREFDAWAKVPDILGANVDGLRDKWTPKLPQKFPRFEGLLSVLPKWEEAAHKDELWFDPTVSVKYWFTIVTDSGTESDRENSKTATGSQWIEPKGKRHPRIVGLPRTGDYLKYISHVRVYRQFKKEFRDGPPKFGKERAVRNILRPEGKDSFPGEFIDTASTKFDKEDFEAA
jgi:hypothetical protein